MSDDVKRARAERMRWIEDALASDLPDELARLAARYGMHKNDKDGRCDPSEDCLAEGINKSPRTVRRLRPKLRELGWISYADNRGGRSKRTQVELTRPPDFVEWRKTASTSKPGHNSVPLSGSAKGPADDEPTWKKPPKEYLEWQKNTPKPGHNYVPVSGPIKGDIQTPKGGHVHGLNPDTAMSPEPIEPIEPTVATAPLAESSRPLPQQVKEESKRTSAGSKKGRKRKQQQQPKSKSCPPSDSTSLQSAEQNRAPAAKGSNGHGSAMPVVTADAMPVVTADPTVIAAAEIVLSEWMAKRERLRTAKNLMPADDEKLRQLNTEVPILEGNIRIAKRLMH